MGPLLQRIEKIYGIPPVVSTKRIEKGFLSENYKLSTSSDSFFLKKYRFDNEKRVRDIHSVKKYFHDKGVPVIKSLSTNTGKPFFEQDGAYFSLSPFVYGVEPKRGSLSERMIVSMGKMLGKIHLLGKDAPLKISSSSSVPNKKESLEIIGLVEKKLSKISNKTGFDKLAEESLSMKKVLIENNGVNYGDINLGQDHLIHGDYLDSNTFFDEKGDVKYIFDFEKTKHEPRTRELFRSATYSFLNTDFNEISIKNIRLYIKSYNETYSIKKEELQNGLMAHYLKSIHGLWVEKEHYLRNNTRVDSFLEFNNKRIKFLSKNLGRILS